MSTNVSALRSLLALCVLSSFGVAAHAANLVTDFGFESAGTGLGTGAGTSTYFTGQSIDGGFWTVTAGEVFIDNTDPYVYANSQSLNLTAANDYLTDTISQMLATTAGTTYTVSFLADSDAPNTFSLKANGVAVTGAPTMIGGGGFPSMVNGGNAAQFVSYDGRFTATSSNTLLSFSAVSNPTLANYNLGFGSLVLDTVTVAPAPTPEPSSVILLLTGLAGVGQTMLRKRLRARTAR